MITSFAQTTFRSRTQKFGIKTDDRRRHMYLIGKTGMGKSTVMENMIVTDIRAGHGVAVVDPHGDLAEKIIEFIPKERINDVIHFNPADIEYPIAFNVVEQVEPHLRHLVASGLIGVFQKLWADSWGPRLEYILRNAILAVLDYPGSTLLAITRMLSDKPFRKKVIAKIQDPVVKKFWTNEFAGYADKFASEAVSPIQNKVGQFLSNSLMRNIVGQVKSALDMRQIMDEGKILILNLSKGRIGEDNSALLGAMMITKIQLAAMSRVDQLEEERRDFYLYIDEFQNFSTDSFANILSEARKYRLNLIIAHQYIEQLNDTVRSAVFGNVGTLVTFRVGATDAEELVREFAPVFSETDIVNLPKYQMYLKLMIDGVSSDPFSATGLVPMREDEKTGNKEKIIRASRERYTKDREKVEEKINRWHDDELDLPTKKSDTDKGAKQQKTKIKEDQNNSQLIIPKSKSLVKKKDQDEQHLSLVKFSQKKNLSLLEKKVLALVKKEEDQGGDDDSKEINNKKINKNNDQKILEKKENLKFKNKESYSVKCSRCGQNTQVYFKPDGVRPVYCKECLAKSKEERKAQMEGKNIKAVKFNELKKEKISQNQKKKNDDSAVSLDQLKKSQPVKFNS